VKCAVKRHHAQGFFQYMDKYAFPTRRDLIRIILAGI